MVVASGVRFSASEGLTLAVREEPGQVVVVLEGELDLATVPRVRETLAAVLAGTGPSRVVLDLAGLEFLDAGGVALILRAEARLSRRGGTLVLRPSRQVRRLLELLELGDLVG